MTYTGEDTKDIAIHVEMLLDDEMRAHAYADKEAHDLPFQIFRVLGGYREALNELSSLRAALAEKTRELGLLRENMDALMHPKDEDHAFMHYEMGDHQKSERMAHAHGWIAGQQYLAPELAEKTAQVERLREALSFYSKEDNYRTTSHGFSAQYDPEPEAIKKDKGKLARESLAATAPKEANT